MFNISNRRYTGAKTKLLKNIEAVLNQTSFKTALKSGSFFDVFAGTGVVSEYFLKEGYFLRFIINDFLHSNFAIFNGFFASGDFDQNKLNKIAKNFNQISLKEQNYYSLNFGEKFFSNQDAVKIGFIRDEIDYLKNANEINQKEFFILLSSLIYSLDKISNTCGHYEAYRKNIILQDRFVFELISPIKTDKKIEIFRQDSNELSKKIRSDIAYIDPPYNSRQYSRFYHLLENITQNKKPELFGVALKPKPENLSAYCTTNAKKAFENLIKNLVNNGTCGILVSYNNTYNSKSNSSQNKINFDELQEILQNFGKIKKFEFDFKAFNAGKTDLKNHKEFIFLGVR